MGDSSKRIVLLLFVCVLFSAALIQASSPYGYDTPQSPGNTPTSSSNSINIVFVNNSANLSHNALAGIQGGAPEQYYHGTLAQSTNWYNHSNALFSVFGSNWYNHSDALFSQFGQFWINQSSPAGNLSFNQTLTDGLYASIAFGYNQTTPAIAYVDGKGFLSSAIANSSFISSTSANSTYLKKTGDTGNGNYSFNGVLNISNASFIQNSPICTAANGFCATTGGNGSFNQTFTDGLYVPYAGSLFNVNLNNKSLSAASVINSTNQQCGYLANQSFIGKCDNWGTSYFHSSTNQYYNETFWGGAQLFFSNPDTNQPDSVQLYHIGNNFIIQNKYVGDFAELDIMNFTQGQFIDGSQICTAANGACASAGGSFNGTYAAKLDSSTANATYLKKTGDTGNGNYSFNGMLNISNTSFILNSPICTAANGFCNFGTFNSSYAAKLDSSTGNTSYLKKTGDTGTGAYLIDGNITIAKDGTASTAYQLNVIATGATASLAERGIGIQQYANGIGAAILGFKRARGTQALPSQVQSGDLVGFFPGYAYTPNGAFTADGSYMGVYVDGAPSGNNVPLGIALRSGSASSLTGSYNPNFHCASNGFCGVGNFFDWINILSGDVYNYPQATLDVNGTFTARGDSNASGNFNVGKKLTTANIAVIPALNITSNLTARGKVFFSNSTNNIMDRCTLSLGTCTISNTQVTAQTNIFCTAQTLGTVTVGQGIAVSARTAGTSYTVTSGSATDTSIVACILMEPIG